MKTVLAAALLMLAVPTQAKIIAEAELQGGSAVVFHDTAGPCLGIALLVEYVAKDGARMPGCYVPRGSTLACVFLDGDIGAVPMSALKPPKDA